MSRYGMQGYRLPTLPSFSSGQPKSSLPRSCLYSIGDPRCDPESSFIQGELRKFQGMNGKPPPQSIFEGGIGGAITGAPQTLKNGGRGNGKPVIVHKGELIINNPFRTVGRKKKKVVKRKKKKVGRKKKK